LSLPATRNNVLRAQDSPTLSASAVSPELPEITLSKRVDEVNLLFTVTDSRGQFINKLELGDLELLDNHQPPEKIAYFHQHSEMPLRVGLVIDVSASITSRFKFEQNAASVFLRRILRPATDEAFVVSFNEKVNLVQDLSSDVEVLSRAVHSLQPGGETALFDAIVFACDKLRNALENKSTRRAIILISDGENNHSRAILYDAQHAAARAETPIFVLSTNDVSSGAYPRGEAILELLARHTGGQILPARENHGVRRAFAQIEGALRSQYAVGYKPAAFTLNGGYRTIEVRPRKRGLKVQCRRGYYATQGE
jgi:VWFA-related protein